jgi:hypothetical protein
MRIPNVTKLGVPGEVDDRGKDILEPLFAIASVLPKWVKRRLVEAAENRCFLNRLRLFSLSLAFVPVGWFLVLAGP